jgi:hypothetical protein
LKNCIARALTYHRTESKKRYVKPPNDFVKHTLIQKKIYKALHETVRHTGYELKLVSVEKIFEFKAEQLSFYAELKSIGIAPDQVFPVPGILGFQISILFFSWDQATIASSEPECVVLLHGLARTERSLLKLEHHLENIGFHVVNVGYPSRKENIQTLALRAIQEACTACTDAGTAKINFVTHSMGGILVRYYLEHNDFPYLGRVVMLSPPNRGSEAVDIFKGTQIFKWLNGPAGQQLGTDERSLPKTLAAPRCEVGIITGDWTINLILSLLIPGKDDGKVSVESAKFEGMKDFLVVPEAHTLIMYDNEVIRQVTFFLKNGVFDKGSTKIDN